MVSRRAFLKITGAVSLAGCGVEPATLGEARDPSEPPVEAPGEDELGTALTDAKPIVEPPEPVPESASFTLGVSAGDLDGSRATLWTHHVGAAPIDVVVWRMAGDVYEAVHARVAVAPSPAGFVHVDVDGLVPGARYRYAFFERDQAGARVARSVVGRFRASPGGAEPLVIGAVSCTNEREPFTVLERAAERAEQGGLDAFLFLGDTAYCDGARTPHEYRQQWRAHIGKPEHVRLRAATSVYATWDDHEVTNDWNPERIDAAHFEAARDALFEHMPLRKVDEDPARIWRSRRWGTCAEIFVLDSRSERLPSTIFGDDEQYVSREQMDWLKQALLDSPCTFKVIMNSVPITRFPNIWNAWQVDRWDAYDQQRTEILTHIDDAAIPGVLWVSGDFHLAKMGFVSPSGPGATQVEVLVGPGAQSGNPLAATLIEPYFHWKSVENNYAELHLDPATGEARIVYVNAAGETIAERTYLLA